MFCYVIEKKREDRGSHAWSVAVDIPGPVTEAKKVGFQYCRNNYFSAGWDRG